MAARNTATKKLWYEDITETEAKLNKRFKLLEDTINNNTLLGVDDAVESDGVLYKINEGMLEVVGVVGDYYRDMLYLPFSCIIADNAFEFSDAFKYVYGDVKKIGNNAFRCSKIERIKFINLETVCDDAFKFCENLTEVDLGRTDCILGNSVFKGCTRLKELVLNKVTSIGYYVFDGCYNLEKIEMLSLKSCDGAIVNDCYNLRTFIAPRVSNLYIEFNDCVKLEILNISAFSPSLKSYSACKELKELWINYLFDVEETFNNFPKLERVEIGNNYSLTGAQKETLKKRRKAKYLEK